MDDLSAKLNQILGSKEGMQQLQNMAAALGLTGTPNTNSGTQNTPQDFQNPFENINIPNQNNDTANNTAMPNIDVNMLLTIQKAMASFNQSNKNVELLRALKPHFNPDRQKKVDDAVRLMQLMNMLPMLKESGLFGLGGEQK